MLIEITSDEELKRLLGIEQGFLLNVNYPANLVKIHRIDCRFCDPENDGGATPSNKKENKTGEYWFSNSFDQIFSKAEEFSAKDYNLKLCNICNPL